MRAGSPLGDIGHKNPRMCKAKTPGPKLDSASCGWSHVTKFGLRLRTVNWNKLCLTYQASDSAGGVQFVFIARRFPDQYSHIPINTSAPLPQQS